MHRSQKQELKRQQKEMQASKMLPLKSQDSCKSESEDSISCDSKLNMNSCAELCNSDKSDILDEQDFAVGERAYSEFNENQL